MKNTHNLPEVSCAGKDQLTHDRARQVSDDMRKRGRKRVQPYHCPHCSAWHVGSRVDKPGKRPASVEKNER